MVKKFFSSYWLVLVLVLVFLLRLPSLFEPFTYGDEGIYLTLGQAARRGLVWYRDIHDNKPPLLYLIAAIAAKFSIYRLIYFLWSLAAILMFHRLTRAIFPKNRPAIALSTSVFAILTNLYTFEGNVANAENFMLLPTIAAFYLAASSLAFEKRFLPNPQKNLTPAKMKHGGYSSELNSWLIIGVLLGLATLFKVPAAFDLGAVAVFLFLVFLEQKKKNYTLYTIRYSLLALGFLLPILLTVIYYTLKGAFLQYLSAALLQNLPYLSSWAGQVQTSGLPLGLILRSLLVLTLIISLFVFRKKISSVVKFILLWFGFSLFAALLSSRPYPHYLIQILPSLSLSFGLLTSKTKKKVAVERLVPTALLLTTVAAFSFFNFWRYQNLPYYSNFYSYLFGRKRQDEYFTYFGGHAQDLYRTAEYIRQRTGKEEKIFIWGTQPSIYALAERLPVGRYTTSYHIIDFDGYQETIQVLEKSQPRYLIVTGEEARPFNQLTSLIENNYALTETFGSIQIFHRISFPNNPIAPIL